MGRTRRPRRPARGRGDVPRDKTCGDGLTPRAVAELDHLGLGDWIRERTVNRGLRLTGWGRELELPWHRGTLPTVGSAVPRAELDDRLRLTAVESGARMIQGAKAVGVARDGDRVRAVTLKTAAGTHTVACEKLIVADGVRSTLGKQLGREWHRDTAYGVAARAYAPSGRSDDPWITSHLELRDDTGALQPGYGWVFPLGTGEVNIGVGTLATAKRPAPGALRPLLDLYVSQRRTEWQLDGAVHSVASALLPMGGAVSNIAGRNWALIGDAAACVNPLNGEGIDYGLEGRAPGGAGARRGRPHRPVAGNPARALRPCVLDRASARGAADARAVPAGVGSGRDALARDDDGRRPGDGQPRHRRGRRRRRSRVADVRRGVVAARFTAAVQLISPALRFRNPRRDLRA
ncbi:geranylgeranyl reductase family protein [Prescottella defluvii]|nr:geranylgeranyl reductase family protein [Prescottella defluvii]